MMRTLLAGLALAGFAALGAPAHASEASYAQCQKAAGGVDPQLRACDAAEIASRDAVLNQGYRKLLAAISPARQALLRTSEHDWIAFRDAECAFRRSAEAGGSDVVLLYDACRLDLTARRIDELSKALNVSSFNECCMTTGQRTKNEKTRSPLRMNGAKQAGLWIWAEMKGKIFKDSMNTSRAVQPASHPSLSRPGLGYVLGQMLR